MILDGLSLRRGNPLGNTITWQHHDALSHGILWHDILQVDRHRILLSILMLLLLPVMACSLFALLIGEVWLLWYG